MAGDKKQYREALKSWDTLRENNHTSVPDDVGKVAILCSGAILNKIGDKPYRRGRKDVRNFYKEGVRIAERTAAEGRKAIVIPGAKEPDFIEVLKDPSISSIVTIGHGTLSIFFLSGSDGVEYVDWRDISTHADHLKTGQFIQRHCGGIDRRLSVPLGTFCMTDHSSVVAPVGMGFEPRGLDHPYNDMLTQVTDSSRMNYDEVLSTFGYIADET